MVPFSFPNTCGEDSGSKSNYQNADPILCHPCQVAHKKLQRDLVFASELASGYPHNTTKVAMRPVGLFYRKLIVNNFYTTGFTDGRFAHCYEPYCSIRG